MHSTLVAYRIHNQDVVPFAFHIKKPHGEVSCLELHVIYLSGSEMAWPKQITAISNPGTRNHDRKRSPDTQRGPSLRPLRAWRRKLLRGWSPWLVNPQFRAECNKFKICTLTHTQAPMRASTHVGIAQEKATWRVVSQKKTLSYGTRIENLGMVPQPTESTGCGFGASIKKGNLLSTSWRVTCSYPGRIRKKPLWLSKHQTFRNSKGRKAHLKLPIPNCKRTHADTNVALRVSGGWNCETTESPHQFWRQKLRLIFWQKKEGSQLSDYRRPQHGSVPHLFLSRTFSPRRLPAPQRFAYRQHTPQQWHFKLSP